MVDNGEVMGDIDVPSLVLDTSVFDSIESSGAVGVRDVVVEDIGPGIVRLLRDGWHNALAFVARKKK